MASMQQKRHISKLRQLEKRSLYKRPSSSTAEVSHYLPTRSFLVQYFQTRALHGYRPFHAGHINHSLFWKNLTPEGKGGGKLKDGKLKAALERDFGSVEAFKKQFNATTAGIQGSGWGWLGYNAKTKKLEIVTTPNQDPLLSASSPSPFSSIANRVSSSRSNHWR
jgi:superoxide dismutase